MYFEFNETTVNKFSFLIYQHYVIVTIVTEGSLNKVCMYVRM